MLTKATVRKQTQRLVPLSGTTCEKCGSSESLQRHHIHYEATAFQILCQSCHAEVHKADGSWGRGLKKTKNCAVCGQTFIPNHSKKHKTCSANCLSELGRRNALKRWRPANESTDLEDSETPSSPKLPTKSY